MKSTDRSFAKLIAAWGLSCLCAACRPARKISPPPRCRDRRSMCRGSRRKCWCARTSPVRRENRRHRYPRHLRARRAHPQTLPHQPNRLLHPRRINGREDDGKAPFTLKPGDSLLIKPGTVHAHWNASTGREAGVHGIHSGGRRTAQRRVCGAIIASPPPEP